MAYSREQIPTGQADITTPEIARHWKQLGQIACHILHVPNMERHNIPTAFQPFRIVYGKENEPLAEYKFGWTIIGHVCLDNKDDGPNCTTVNRVTERREDP